MGRHERSVSFSGIDEVETSNIIANVIRQNKIFLGGCSVGKGLTKAARYYLNERIHKTERPEHFKLPGATHLNTDIDWTPPEDAFYVVDLGVIVSQVYQWRNYFPRVEPFYAVKCNPDPVILRILAILGLNFDCASRNEIRLVQEAAKGLARQPQIIFANPCKAPAHILEAVCKGVKLVTFDNVAEVEKCARISKSIELILRIVTDDRGSQCRLSSKFGAPRIKWRPLLAAAKKHGLQVVGVSFHVGSGCRDASRYELALRDAREIFDMAKKDFGFNLTILDIGGGFPGETHSLWNPYLLEEDIMQDDDKEANEKEGTKSDDSDENKESEELDHFMFFQEIAEKVAPVIDEIFPPDSGIRVIGEPGRYLVAACATLCCSVVGVRDNKVDESFEAEPVDDKETAMMLDGMSRDEELDLVRDASKNTRSSLRKLSLGEKDTDEVLEHIVGELAEYSRLFARQNLAQQEADVYNDSIDFFNTDFETAANMLGPPDPEKQEAKTHTVEGMNYPLVGADDNEEANAYITLAAAGEAVINGVVMQAVAEAPFQDSYAVYINDGVYGAMNNIMFDHASLRPRVLRGAMEDIRATTDSEGFRVLKSQESESELSNQELFPTTVFGPTCDSIDVVTRSALLPKMKIGDWLYFQNMGAYTMAAASSFNGFVPSEKFYVCSVKPEFLEALIAGPEGGEEEKKEGS